MFCMKCGGQMEDSALFCPFCGTKQEEAAPMVKVDAPVNNGFAPQEPIASQVQPTAQNLVGPAWNNSYFDGGLLGLIGVNLVTAFVSAITLGLAGPAMWCYRLRWIYKHTIIGGYRLKFTGKGIQLFGKSLLWALLTLITLSIYGWWLPIKYKKWEVSHVEIDSIVVK